MGTGSFRLSYPVTAEVRTALARFPEIEKAVRVPAAGRSELEVVRLLGNTHYPHVDHLLAFIEGELSHVGEIGARAVSRTDPFELREALAELCLVSHLWKHLGSAVRPATAPARSDKRPDIEVTWGGLVVRIEVYSPLDLLGFQLLEQYLPPLFKYLDVGRGFAIDIAVHPVDTSVRGVLYPYTFPGREDMVAWLEGIGRVAHAFLGRPAVAPGEQVRLPGPSGTTTLQLRVQQVFDDPSIRRVGFTRSTHSADARLLFECGTAADTARSPWARKLKGKMRQRQAGPPAPGVLRMFIVNLAQADTGWPDFFTWPDIAQRFEDAVRLISAELSSGLAYDVVVPARLDVGSCFGQAIWLNPSVETEGRGFVGATQLDRPGSAPRVAAPLPAADLRDFLGSSLTDLEENEP